MPVLPPLQAWEPLPQPLQPPLHQPLQPPFQQPLQQPLQQPFQPPLQPPLQAWEVQCTPRAGEDAMAATSSHANAAAGAAAEKPLVLVAEGCALGDSSCGAKAATFGGKAAARNEATLPANEATLPANGAVPGTAHLTADDTTCSSARGGQREPAPGEEAVSVTPLGTDALSGFVKRAAEVPKWRRRFVLHAIGDRLGDRLAGARTASPGRRGGASKEECHKDWRTPTRLP